ncbi:ABC transporter ATP-binding protein [Texcoconibacillus texcoconensis]|uniref:Iron complex transport system ATP-binding protein n=1 Tax=Texcoconibacillus texcoconensis TaxID=1095777 RepID=A0A840QNH8_9BACI|nr:ABC transporter ATP-binding protein [Texcoconibacillus texcoconensis]MBB5172942.1 iron complex transport system ATP-binding protein [Texcoconibacillus texcoconensis]
MLKVERLTGGYEKDPVVDRIQFHVNTGEVFGILGPNGSGKTTLLNLLTGRLPKQDGEITLNGQSIAMFSRKQLAQKIAVVHQQPETSFSFTVEQVVRMGRYPHEHGIFGTDLKKGEQIVQWAMEVTQVRGFRNQFMHQLSGGEKQRVFLARALAQEPQLLVFDEPTNHLDIGYQVHFLNEMRRIANEQQVATLTVLHDLNMASLFCDRVMLLNEGKVSAVGNPFDVLKQGSLNDVYKTTFERKEHPRVAKPLITFTPNQNEEVEASLRFVDYKHQQQSTVLSSKSHMKTLNLALEGDAFSWYNDWKVSYVKNDRDVNSEGDQGELVLLVNGERTSYIFQTLANDTVCLYAEKRMLQNETSYIFFIFIHQDMSETALLRIYFDILESVKRMIKKEGHSLKESPKLTMASAQKSGRLWHGDHEKLVFEVENALYTGWREVKCEGDVHEHLHT